MSEVAPTLTVKSPVVCYCVSVFKVVYSIIFYIQNIGLSMVPVLIGNVIGKYTQNGTTDYTVPMLIFAAFGGIAVVIALMLLAEDKRKHYGLQEANKKS